jgi:hypothetical protein
VALTRKTIEAEERQREVWREARATIARMLRASGAVVGNGAQRATADGLLRCAVVAEADAQDIPPRAVWQTARLSTHRCHQPWPGPGDQR